MLHALCANVNGRGKPKTEPGRESHRCPAALLDACSPKSLSVSILEEGSPPPPPRIQPLRSLKDGHQWRKAFQHVHGDALAFVRLGNKPCGESNGKNDARIRPPCFLLSEVFRSTISPASCWSITPVRAPLIDVFLKALHTTAGNLSVHLQVAVNYHSNLERHRRTHRPSFSETHPSEHPCQAAGQCAGR
jgi:hypothetical protein